MKKRYSTFAVISLGCSVAPVFLALWTFYLYFFGSTDKKTSEDILEHGLISLWMIPLVIAGICFGAFAREFRLTCVGFGLVSVLCWACIIIADGGLW